MLIFSRRDGESFMIGDNIEIVIFERRGNQTRIGVNAPKDVKVHRAEVYKRIQEEQENAPSSTIPETESQA